MAGAVLNFNEQMEHILEVALVLIIGVLLSPSCLRFDEVWFISLLFLVIAAVLAGLVGSTRATAEHGLLCWFGIRGICSVYYPMYAANRGLGAEVAWQLTSTTLNVIAVAIVVHGITVTPLMGWHHPATPATRGQRMNCPTTSRS